MNAADVMAATVADLVALIEAGAPEWQMPWTHDGTTGVPHNAVTRRPYSGGNVLALWAASARHGWGHEWATFNQWQTVGATVRKGERGTHCIYRNVKPAETITDVDPDTGDEITLTTGPRVRWARAFVVLNAAQVDGYNSTETKPAAPEPSVAGDWFCRIPAYVDWDAGNPCYIPSQDRVLMPAASAFVTEAARWGTLAHDPLTAPSDQLEHHLGGASPCDQVALERRHIGRSAGDSGTARGDASCRRQRWSRRTLRRSTRCSAARRGRRAGERCRRVLANVGGV